MLPQTGTNKTFNCTKSYLQIQIHIKLPVLAIKLQQKIIYNIKNFHNMQIVIYPPNHYH